MASILNVNNIQSAEDSAASLTFGGVVSSGYALTCAGGVNVSGVVTATSFVGNGSSLTSLPLAESSTVVALYLIQ